MCRHNQLLGFALLSFGIGTLVGLWVEGGFLAYCFSFGTILLGAALIKKK